MSREGGKPGKPGTTSRHITPDEAELWSRTTLSVAKVKVKPRVATHAAEPAAEAGQPAKPEPARAKRQAAAPPRLTAARPSAQSPPTAPPAAPPVAEFDRRSLPQGLHWQGRHRRDPRSARPAAR